MVDTIKSREEVETFTEELMNAIKIASDNTIPKCRYSTKDNKWWGSELTALKKRLNALKRRVNYARAHGQGLEVLEEFKAARSEYRTQIKIAKTKMLRERLESVDETNVWESDYKLYKNQDDAVLGQIEKPDGSSTQSVKETNEFMLENFFPDTPQTTTLEMSIDETISDDPFFSSHEIEDAFNSLDNGKAPGFDYLTAHIIKASYKHLKAIINNWLNLCLKFGVFPRYFKRSRVKLIPKPKSSPQTPQGWRPICLLPIMAKVLDKLMTDRLQWHLWKRNKMSTNQYGFRPQNSTLDAIEDLVQHIDEQHEKGWRTLLISLDCTKAFDCAEYVEIMNAIKSKECPPNLTRLLEDYLKQRIVAIETETGSVQKAQTQGAAQGSVAGPILWNALFDEVLNMDFGQNMRLQSYADDLLAEISIPIRRNHHKGEGRVKNQIKSLVNIGNDVLKELSEWGKKRGINFNPEKTQAIIVKTKDTGQTTLEMNGSEIKITEELTVLGITIDSKLKFNKHIQERSDKATELTTKLSPMMTNVYGIQPSARQMLYRQAIEPTMTYGWPLIYERCLIGVNRVRLERAQRIAMGRHASGYRDCSHCSLTAITGQTIKPTTSPTPIRAMVPHFFKHLLFTKSSVTLCFTSLSVFPLPFPLPFPLLLL